MDDKTNSEKPECVTTCPENYNYYNNSDKICRGQNCSDSYDKYVNKHDINGDSPYSTYECVNNCSIGCYYLGNESSHKICMGMQCNNESSSLKNYYKKDDEDSSAYYRCVA